MKYLIVMAALAVTSTAFAAEVSVKRAALGSGTPALNASGVENAIVVDNAKVENDILHAPQYMPNYPTAATIWPRVIEVPCTKDVVGKVVCAGYNWSPSMGPGEYLFVRPKVVVAPEPRIFTERVEVPVPVIVTREVFIEVPVKKKKE